MRSTEKTVLFGRATINKQVHSWPIATFSTPVSAKTYAAYIKMAHSAGDVETAKRLDPKTRLAEDGTILPGQKFSLVSMPYEPSAVADLSDDDLVESTPAS